MKKCQNCNKELLDDAKFCDGCGARVYSSEIPYINKRDIALCVILTILTCGIYGIYWFIVFSDDVNSLSNDNSISGGLAFVLTILTCGIFGIYWHYTLGKKLYEAGQKHNKMIADNSILYLILCLFGFGIINYCLIQNDLNKFAE